MGYGFKHGGTAASVKLNVIGGTRPDTAPVNTIWVDSSAPVTSWLVASRRPSEAFDGMVFIEMGSEAAVDIPVAKGINVQPVAAWQYISGAWSAKTGWAYMEDWIKFSSAWDGYYFRDGEQYIDITGGWTTDGWGGTGGSTKIAEILMVTSSSNATARLGTVNAVDLTNVNTIWYNSPKGNDGASYPGYLCVATQKTGASSDRVKTATIRDAGTGYIDVSDINGAHYIYLYALGGSGSARGYADIDRIWTE